MQRRFPVFVCGFLMLWGSGCGSSRSHDDLIPAQDKARQALETALTAWKNGQRPGKIESASQRIQVVDSKWRDGQKLERFEIIKDEESTGPRRFSVKLNFKGQPGEQVVRYVCIGRDPIWVYRQEDFDKLSGMQSAGGY